jgi:hypothetical protein
MIFCFASWVKRRFEQSTLMMRCSLSPSAGGPPIMAHSFVGFPVGRRDSTAKLQAGTTEQGGCSIRLIRPRMNMSADLVQNTGFKVSA